MRFVSIKQTWQQDIQGVHRMRERLIRNRTALCNQIRGLLQEYGKVAPQGMRALKTLLPLVQEDERLSPILRGIVTSLYEELQALEKRIDQCESTIKQIFKEQEACQRLAQVEGVGFLIATAVVARHRQGRRIQERSSVRGVARVSPSAALDRR